MSKQATQVERWLPIPGWEDTYQISDRGRLKRMKQVRNWVAGRITTGAPQHGYRAVLLYRNGKRIPKRIHQLVAEAFIGPLPIGMEVNHKNGSKSDNRLENLEYVTHGDNVRHAWKLGLANPLRGSEIKVSKLLEADIPAILALRATGLTFTEIGRRYGVKYGTVARICKGKAWTHVTKECVA